MAQIGLIPTSSHGTPCLCLHSCRGVFRLLSCRCTYEHVHQTEAMQVCRKAIFFAVCLAAMPLPNLWDPCSYQSWPQRQLHTQPPNTFPRQRRATMWELAHATLQNFWKHRTWNLKLFNLAGWQQQNKGRSVRQRCNFEIRNITNSNGTKEDCVRQRCKVEIRNITNRSNRTKQDCVRQRCKLEIRNITNHTQD